MPTHPTKNYQLWETRVEAGLKHLEDKLDHRWKSMLNMYRNQYPKNAKLGDYEVTVNMVRAITGIVIPAVYFRDPTVRCQPRIAGTEFQCKLTEELLNYYLRELRVKRQVKKIILDALLFGRGYMKLGYEVQVEVEDVEPIEDPETGEQITNAVGEPLVRDPEGNVYILQGGVLRPFMNADGTAVSPGNLLPHLHEDIRREQPYMLRWSPWDVIVDPDCTDVHLGNAMWVGCRSILPLEEVKNHPLYTGTKDLQGTKEPDYLREVRNKHLLRDEDDVERVELYEIWHKEYNKNTKNYEMKWKVMAKGHDRFLLDEPSPYIMEGFPLEVLTFEIDPESRDPQSPIEIVMPQMEIINVSRSQYTTHRERFNQKYVFNRSAGITDRDAKNIAQGPAGAFIGVKMDPQIPVGNAIAPVVVPPMMAEIYNDAEIAFEDLRRIFGLNDYHLGGTGIGREPTEASYIENAFSVRLNEKQDAVGDLLHESLRKVKQILQQWADFETQFQITHQGEQVWATFVVADNIPKDLEFVIDIHTASFQDKATERKDMLDLLNITAAIPEVNKLPILERLFKTYGFPDPNMLIQPVAPPVTGPDGQPLEPGGPATANAIDPAALNQPPNTDAGNTGRVASA